MKDVFKEQLVKRRPSMKTTMAKVGIVAAAIFLILVFFMFAQFIAMFLPILWVATIFGAYIMFRRFDIEYEYILTNNELDIDIIYGKSRRKRIFSSSVRDFDAFRQVGSTEMQHSFSGGATKADYTGGISPDIKQYEFITTYKSKKMHILFEPNQDLLSSIIPHLKRGTYPSSLKA
ncbi:MAG: DUF6106 family protein [Defluviitaleaceae bacterium]|nr:DUF6106 family protein [Defluviitaleaceae bacterium]